MTTMKHTPEPWTLNCSGVFDPKGERVCDRIAEHDARRMVACVNACRGLPTEALEAHLVEDLVGGLRRAHTLLEKGAASCDGETNMTMDFLAVLLERVEGRK